jgi:hypothetical protein
MSAALPWMGPVCRMAHYPMNRWDMVRKGFRLQSPVFDLPALTSDNPENS